MFYWELLQLAILDPVRLVRRRTQPLLSVFLVITKVAFVEHHTTVVLISEDVGSNAIQEPAIVRNHHSSTGEGQYGFF